MPKWRRFPPVSTQPPPPLPLPPPPPFPGNTRPLPTMQTLPTRTGDGLHDHPIGLGSKEECEAMRRAGNAKMKEGDYKAADAFYGMSLGTAMDVDQYAMGHNNRAAARLAMKQYAAAEADASRAASLAPENPKAHFRYAEALFGLGKHQAALESYRKADEICPNDRKILDGIAAAEKAILHNSDGAKRVMRAHEQSMQILRSEIMKRQEDKINPPEDNVDPPPASPPPLVDDASDEIIDLDTEDPRIKNTVAETINADEKKDNTDDSSTSGSGSSCSSEERTLRQEMKALKRKLKAKKKRKANSPKSTTPAMYVPTSADRSDSPEVIEVEDRSKIVLAYSYPQRCGPKKPEVAKKNTKLDYAKFDTICEDLSDDETPDATSNRLILEGASDTDKALVKDLFDHFDSGNHSWSFEDARKATKAFEGGKDLTKAQYLEKATAYGYDAEEDGWPLEVVQCMYLSSERTHGILIKHTQILNEIKRCEGGVTVQTYSPGESVEGYIDLLWRPGTIHCMSQQHSDPSQCLYDVIWPNGTGTRNVPGQNLRSRCVAYTGPSGLRGEGKKIAATHTLDPNSGIMKPKDLSTSSRIEVLDGEIGDNLLDELPPKTDLPEDPVERLSMTVEASGLGDETTGFLSKEKVRNMLGQRTRG